MRARAGTIAGKVMEEGKSVSGSLSGSAMAGETRGAYEHKYDSGCNDEVSPSSYSEHNIASASLAPVEANPPSSTASSTATFAADSGAAEKSADGSVRAATMVQTSSTGHCVRISHKLYDNAWRGGGTEVWNSGTQWDEDLFGELVAHVPASILQCAAVSRSKFLFP